MQVPVESIAGSIKVSREVLEDVPRVQSLIEGRLQDRLRAQVVAQILAGNGSSPNQRGINATTNIQTGSVATGDTMHTGKVDAIASVAASIYANTDSGEASVAVLTPGDLWNIMQAKDSNGAYLFPAYRDGSAVTPFGIPMVGTSRQTTNRITVFNTSAVELAVRSDYEAEIGFDADDWTKYLRTIRADVRLAFMVINPRACGLITITP